MAVRDQPVGAGPRAKSREQHHLQVAAMDRELWMVVAGRAAQRLLVDQLAEAVEEGCILGFDRDPRKRFFQTEPGELLGRVRKQIDADTDRPDVGDGLIDAAGDAGLVQRKPQRQAADARAHDDDVVHASAPEIPDWERSNTISKLTVNL